MGICALCGNSGKLHESHFLPRGLYRLLRESNNRNSNPVLMSRRVTTQKSFQMTQPLLCSACERRFSENGENYVIPLLKQRTKFPLLDRLNLALPVYATRQNAAFTCPAVGLDGEKIAYFGLSILWRAAERSWRTFDGELISVNLDARYQESIRRYLLGEAPFPPEVAVSATVATDFVSQNTCLVPNRITDNTMLVVYGLVIKGLSLRFVFGDNHAPAMRAISCGGPGPNMIFMRDCSENSWPAVERIMETSVPKGQLADTRSRII